LNTRHLVDPDLLPLIDLAPTDPITPDNLAATRAAMNVRFEGLPRPSITPTVAFAQGRDGAPDVPLFIYDPGGQGSRAAILHIHGGGMIAGRAELTVFGTAPIALGLGVVVVSVDYRLAPETPFPGLQEDCYAALEWLFVHANELRIEPARIAVSGDSAGGGLATALALMLRDRGGPKLAAQLLTYPMLDYRTGGPEDPYLNATTGEFVWTRERNQFGWQSLRGGYIPADTRKGWFSPMLADNLLHLPPTWIGTGSLDLFLDENKAFARCLSAAEVSVDFRVYAGGVHGFNTVSAASLSRRFAADFETAVRRHLVI